MLKADLQLSRTHGMHPSKVHIYLIYVSVRQILGLTIGS